ncbi:sodium-dependent transporter [Helicobacter mustelae]|uniref:Transporter n=1 Tax=Helicobacter mustelae (strain ATCC 43772 / CCUG 25715 / CIP 103759 / LMG 18044 / NCTC 12198 / R85-136P) TaxID=679897 RepID=D3UJ90_HELM1|nr:sodium-dependent transporter [Helicobacter mustelae]CBG40565.1 putative transmembrane transport protein [Helicobacter mustelae 12198]SQH72062.1 transmembrane transport protein [Helicobacter mustelae]
MNDFSKLGFILATLGSAIGLGHIWRFPYVAGTSGGGAFVLLFLLIAFVIGVSMLIAEMIIGNRTKTNLQDAFVKLDKSKKKRWRWAGIILIGGPTILTFYCIVLGWVLYYLFAISLDLPSTIEESRATFENLVTANLTTQILGFGAVVAITGYFVSRGVKSGIESLNFILMPLLFIIFIGLLFYAMTMPHFPQGWHYMFDFDFSKINSTVLVNSLGQVFFSLSIGAGTIITYAAATEEKQNLFASAMWVVIPGIMISLIAGITIFTFVFEYGAQPDGGPGLVFVTLPLVFYKMGIVGHVICALFMIGLAFAGISSTVSLLEPAVKWMEDKTRLNRFQSSWLLSFLIFVVGVVLIFSLNKDYSSMLSIKGKSLFDAMDWLSANIIMTLGGLASCIFVGWGIKKERLREFTSHYLNPAIFVFWLFCLRYLAPITVLTILVYNLLH